MSASVHDFEVVATLSEEQRAAVVRVVLHSVNEVVNRYSDEMGCVYGSYLTEPFSAFQHELEIGGLHR